MARAVLQRSNIVILDEATSALDVATEKSLLQAVAVAFADKTVITIAVSKKVFANTILIKLITKWILAYSRYSIVLIKLLISSMPKLTLTLVRSILHFFS